MALRYLRTAAALLFLAPACVVRLSERNDPLPNGGVSGPAVDCSAVQPEPEGAPAGAAETVFVGRYDSINRADPNAPKLRFDWSGNSMRARFEGSEVTWGVNIGLPPDDPDADEGIKEQVFEVIIDGKAQQVILPDYATDPANPRFTSTHRLPSGTHEITVVRSSEADGGPLAWVPFTFPGGTQLPPMRYPRKIEYIGDSITCGYGNEGANATCPFAVATREVDGKPVLVPETQNIYLAYGSIAARKLSAEATTLCFSGKGVVKNYRERNQGRDAETTIPQYYLRTLAKEDPVKKEGAEFEKDRVGVPWKFDEAEKPDVVFINLGQNDFGRDVDQNNVADGIDLAGFRAGYKDFVVNVVRPKRPDAHIFLAVPPMVTDLFPLDNARTNFRNTLRSIVSELNAAGDTKVYFVELVEMGVRYGLGCDYHPNLEVHRIMADQVVGAVSSKTCWSTVPAQ